MLQSKIHETSPAGTVEGEPVDYRPLSVMAIAGLAAGLASPLAFAHPVLWCIPLVAVAVNVAALVRIRTHEPKLVGRRAALAGLVLALGFGGSAPTYWSIYQYQLRLEARQFSLGWFDLLRAGEAHKAHQYTVTSYARLPLDDNLWTHYAGQEALYGGLVTFTNKPEVRALLEVGTEAEVRFYRTVSVGAHKDQEIVKQLYAVSFPQDGKLKSYFVTITATRVFNVVKESNEWVVDHVDMVVRVPDDLPDED